MKKFKLYANLLALIMLVAEAAAFADVTISLDPSSINNQAGAQFEVVAKVESPTTGLTSVFAVMNWNPAVLELVSCVPAEGYEDPDKYYSSFGSEVADGIAYVGLGSGDGSVCIPAGFDAPVATFTFKVKEGVEKGTEIALNLFNDASKGAAGDGMDAVIGAFDANTTGVDMVFVDATGEVVKLFNVSSYQTTLDDGWTPDNFYQIPLGINVSYTNEKGAAYSTEGGSVTAIDTANITLKVGEKEEGYDAAKYGEFKLYSNNKGTVYWDGKVTVPTNHQNLVFVIPFTATSSDNKYTDKNTLTMTVVPANSKPVVSDFTVVNDDDYAMMETMKVKFTFKITDADGDAAEPVAGSVKLNGEAFAGAFVREEAGWSFTSTNALSQDLVSHTGTSVNNLYYKPWTITFQVTDGIATVDDEEASDPDRLTTGIQDVDREVTAPTFTKYEPAEPTTNNDISVVYGEATDADGDEITYTVVWTKGGTSYAGDKLPAAQTAKGEKWKATIWAIAQVGTTTKDSRKYVDGPEITIGNSKPELTAEKTSVFIRKGEATSATVKFTITDADEADTFTIANAVGQRGGVTPYEGAVGREFEVTFNVLNPGVEFTDGSITVKVNDGTADSDEVTVAVSYRDNPPPVIEDGESAFTIDEVDADKQASTVTLKVKASDSKEVAPYGIQSIAWTITDGEGSIIFGTEYIKNNTAAADGNFPEEDEMEVIVKTKGYSTLDGKDRAASADYKVKVTVTDAMGVATEKEFTVTVNDTDRPASAPNNCDVVYVGGNKTGATIQAHAQGAADPDGDEVSYVYELYVDDELVETSEATAPGTDLTFATALKKGQTPEVVVTAVSKPDYEGGVQVESDEYKTGKLSKINNTAPEITVPEGDGAVAIDEFVEGYNEADATLTIGADADVKFAYKDIDEDAGVDEVEVTVDDAGLAGFATADIVDGKLVITRKPNVNTVGLDELPYFTVKATDQDGAVAEAKFNLTINPINTKPSVTVSDIYVTPEDAEFEETFAVTSFGLSADEAEQKIVNDVDADIEDEAGLLASYVIFIPGDGKSVIVRGTLNQNVEPGSEAIIKFKVQDNGGTPFEDTSDELRIKVSIGSTPWYPVVTVPCDEHPMHQVTLTGDGDSVTLIVEGDTIYPADFYNQGCKGLKSGATYAVKCWAWTAEDGAADEECGAAGEVNIVAYDKPGKATVEVADGSAANKKKITVKVPLASKYTVTIKRDGSLYKTVKKDFTPGDNGFITPADEFELELFDAGTYEVTAYGTNPENKDGEVSDAVEFDIEGGEAVLEWPDGAFSPDGEIKYIGESVKETTVRFNWPIVSAATKYVLCIEGIAAGISEEIELAENSYEYTFKKLGDQTDISWWVVAKNDNDEVSSDSFAFSIVRQSDKAIITGVESLGGGDLLIKVIKPHDNANLFTKADIQLAHIVGNKVTWYKAEKAAVTEVDGGVQVSINGTAAAGDIVYIRPNTSGASEWSIFTVKGN